MGSSTLPCNVTRLYCSDCGIANISVTDSRIVNGSDASPNEYPYQVRLSLNFTNSFYSCGGSIIKRKWILTAAHCIINKGLLADTIEVFYGHIDDRQAKSVMASRFFAHENYNETSFANDIAVVELSENFDFSDPTIQSICIAEEIDIPFGGKAIATGWGALSTNGSSPDILQEVAVDIINNTLCKELFILPPEGEKAVCAFTPYKGICFGDSGGPLAAKLCNDRWVVFGISSYVSGSGCATATIPSVFTRVPPYRSWIDEKTGSASC